MEEDGTNSFKTIREITRACCVPFCKTLHFTRKQLGETSFYAFPDPATDLITHRCWLREVRKIKTEVGESLHEAGNAFLCELHFRKEDFVLDVVAGKKLLRKGSVPYFPYDKNGNKTNLEVRSSNEGDLAEEQKKLRDYKLSLLKQKIEFQKDPSRLKLLQQKEEQEEKLRLLLAQQEEHKKQISKEKQKTCHIPAPNLEKLEREQLDELEKVRKLENKEKETKKQEQDLSVKPSKMIENDNSNVWRKKKENLKLMLEQQKERLAEIQKQESNFDARKRKRQQTEEDIKIENEISAISPVSIASSSNTSVISCGKCLKLQAQLSDVSLRYEDLKEENEMLRDQVKRYLSQL